MNAKINQQKVDKSKVMVIVLLTVLSVMITLSGIIFGIVSIFQNIQYRVFNTTIPGFIFGLVICYLGIRYLLSVQNLKSKVYQTKSTFSWQNFKK